MKPQAQKEWGTRVSLDFFLGGAGAGLIAVYLAAALIAGRHPFSLSVLATGGTLVVVGILLLLSELGRPANSVRSILNIGSSWMARGAIFNLLLIGFVVLTLLADSFGAGRLALVSALLAMISAILVAVYPGLVLFSTHDIGLWRSALLPLMFFGYSITSGVSLLLIADGGSSLQLGFSLAKLELVLIVTVGVLFVAYWAGRVSAKTAGVERGLNQLMRGKLRGAFVFGTIGIGLILPLFCFVEVAFIGGQAVAVLSVVGPVCFLVGAFLIRYCILRAACHEPLGFLGKSS